MPFECPHTVLLEAAGQRSWASAFLNDSALSGNRDFGQAGAFGRLSGNPGGLNGSTQHQLETYLRASQQQEVVRER